MKTFTLELKCDNAAFDNDGLSVSDATLDQVALILRDAAKHVKNGCTSRNLMDANGNTVGSYAFSGYMTGDVDSGLF